MRKYDFRGSCIRLALVTFCSLMIVQTGIAYPWQSSVPASENFSWSGELVALDETAAILTVKASVVGDEAPKFFAGAKAGERLTLTWSGVDKYSDAINGATKYNAAKSKERFVFPAEFVAFDASRRYVTFKVPIPKESIAQIKTVKPGEWITATSPHGQASDSKPIAGVVPYGTPTKS
jgi:hypothetical protein